METFFKTPVVRVEQPLGEFYIAAIPARILLDLCFSKELSVSVSDDGKYELAGAQRSVHEPRLRTIGKYINRDEAAFPNSIILAANSKQDVRGIEDNEDIRWRIEALNGDGLQLVIPKNVMLAQIIDGQHRLFGFSFADPDRLDCMLNCSIYIDLPEPMQAQLFATINSKQKQVDKSLTYELFGYNIEEESPEYWGPDKLAVLLARKLNAKSESPLQNHVLVAARNDFVLSRASAKKQGLWMISMATLVDGIIKLITKNVDNDLEILSEKKQVS
ncbi:MAG: DGQHR domain-containing protein, partial [Kordiimonas sp.]